MLNPVGTLSLASGNLSAAAGIGGGATGASFAAASLPAGRPIRGDPGGSGAAAVGAAAAGGVAGCWAAAPNLNAPMKHPASNKPPDVEKIVMKPSPMWQAFFLARPSTEPRVAGFPGPQCPIFLRG